MDSNKLSISGQLIWFVKNAVINTATSLKRANRISCFKLDADVGLPK